MRRESHVRIWESGGVRFPSATRLSARLWRGQRGTRLDWPVSRDCQKFRVWAGIMGKKEPQYVTTQRAYDTQ